MNVFVLDIDPRPGHLVRFVIDGVDIFERIAVVERRFVTTEGAGSYVSPPLEVVLEPSRHMLGEPTDTEWGEESTNGKIAIGGCGCGEVGCWPLLVKVEVDLSTVTWRDFENPFRGPGSVHPGDPTARPWDWSSVGPFVFNRKRYEYQLRRR